MIYYKENTLPQVNIRELISMIVLSTIAILIPFFIHLQWISGPIINAILIIALFQIGIRSAFVLCLVPSLMALSGGLLPALLAPALPFIMISNVVLVLCVDYFYSINKNKLQGFIYGAVTGASLKFLFLYFSTNLVSSLLLKQELALKIAQLFSWTQIFSALSGAMIAFVILKFLRKF